MVGMGSGQSPTKVTQLLYSGLGGHASVAFSLLDAGACRAWSSSMVFMGNEALEPAYRRKCRKNDVPFRCIRTRRGKPWWGWPAIVSTLRRLRPDVILLHSVSSLFPAALYCLLYRADLIAIEHTPIALKSRSERLMSGLALLFAKHVVVLTVAYREEHLAGFKWFRKHRKIKLIPNGIDMDRYSRGICRPSPGSCRIGMAARFSGNKRQALLVSALILLLERCPEVDWRLTLAGDGDCHGQVRALVNESGLGDRIELVGNLGESALVSWFRSLDLYAHASEGETLSTSMLQAMSMGLPMVASAVAGIDNLLYHEGVYAGVLIRENTPSAFAAGIEGLQADVGLQVRLATVAREQVTGLYSQEIMFRNYSGTRYCA